MNYIYIHFDPRTMAARYVGRSSSPVYRYYQHSNSANKIGEWFNQLHKLGLVPLMKIVDEVETEEEAVEREAYWIRFCEKHGANLLNFQRQHHIQLDDDFYEKLFPTERETPLLDTEAAMNDIVECIIQGRFGDINMKNVARVQEGIQNEAKYQRILTSGFRHRRVKHTA